MSKLKLFTLESPVGLLRGALGPQGMVALTMRQDGGEYLRKILARRKPGAEWEEVAAESTKPGRQLAAYFKNPRARLDAALDLEGLTPFTQAALLTLREIPPGQTLTYGQVARIVGRPKAPRAVGQALHHNPPAPVPGLPPGDRVRRQPHRLRLGPAGQGGALGLGAGRKPLDVA